MVASQSPGSSSCVRLFDKAKLTAALAEICKGQLSPLVTALGSKADLHLVGGAVRDCALGVTQFDCDIACAYPAQTTKELLEKAGIRVIETGLKHGTVTAVIDGRNIEITAFRKPGTQTPAATVEEDLFFRDFTINAMAFSLSSENLIDPLMGLDDLAAGVLRCTGPCEQRFVDDPLRILRAIRFGQAAGRTVHEDIIHASSCRRDLLKKVSIERIREELKKILLADHAGAAVRALAQLELLQFIIPELIPSIGFEQNDFHIHDVFEHTLWVLDRCPRDLIMRLAAVFHDIAKPSTLSVDDKKRRHFYRHEEVGAEITRSCMERLKFSNSETNAVCSLVRHHMRPIDCGEPGLRRIMRDLGEQFSRWRQFKVADAPPKTEQQELDAAFARFDAIYMSEVERQKGAPYGKLAINGEDLKGLGLRPGPGMGRVLKSLEEIVLDDPKLNQHDILIQRAQQLIAEFAKQPT